MAIPLGALAAIAQNLLFGVLGLSALIDVAEEDPVIAALAAVLFGAFSTLIAATLVYAACAEALDRIDEGEQPDVSTPTAASFRRCSRLPGRRCE